MLYCTLKYGATVYETTIEHKECKILRMVPMLIKKGLVYLGVMSTLNYSGLVHTSKLVLDIIILLN